MDPKTPSTAPKNRYRVVRFYEMDDHTRAIAADRYLKEGPFLVLDTETNERMLVLPTLSADDDLRHRLLWLTVDHAMLTTDDGLRSFRRLAMSEEYLMRFEAAHGRPAENADEVFAWAEGMTDSERPTFPGDEAQRRTRERMWRHHVAREARQRGPSTAWHENYYGHKR